MNRIDIDVLKNKNKEKGVLKRVYIIILKNKF